MSGCLNKLNGHQAVEVRLHLEDFIKFFYYYVNVKNANIAGEKVYFYPTSADSNSIKTLLELYNNHDVQAKLRNDRECPLPTAKKFQDNIDRWYNLNYEGMYSRPVNTAAQATERAHVGLFLNHVVVALFLNKFKKGKPFEKITQWEPRNIPEGRCMNKDESHWKGDFSFDYIDSVIRGNIRYGDENGVIFPFPWIMQTVDDCSLGTTFTEDIYSLHACILERLDPVKSPRESSGGSPHGFHGASSSYLSNPYMVNIGGWRKFIIDQRHQ